MNHSHLIVDQEAWDEGMLSVLPIYTEIESGKGCDCDRGEYQGKARALLVAESARTPKIGPT
jgi:hypothetical protein